MNQRMCVNFIILKKHVHALFTLNSLYDVVPPVLSEKLTLFDAMILPISNYGYEVCGFHKAPDIEKVYVRFLKQSLHARQQTTDVIKLFTSESLNMV